MNGFNPTLAEPGYTMSFANSVDPDQLASDEANWSGYALFVVKYVNLYQESGSSNRISWKLEVALRKHAYSNTLKILPPKNENFQIKNSDIFHISAQNIDCGYSSEPPRRGRFQRVPTIYVLNRNKKNNVYPCKPQFYCIKVGFKGVKLI